MTESNKGSFTLSQLFNVLNGDVKCRIFHTYSGEEIQRPIYEGTLSAELPFMNRVIDSMRILQGSLLEIELSN